MYRAFLRPLLFQFDSERVHDLTMLAGRALVASGASSLARGFLKQEPLLPQDWGTCRFSNPLGVAAGFDKNGCLGPLLETLGFGFLEVGTVTPQPQSGNPKPRIFRSPAHGALINRMGFPSAGVDAVLRNVQRAPVQCPLFFNAGKNLTTALENAEEDYRLVTGKAKDVADFVVINVSSPNTPGLRDLQRPEELERILASVVSAGEIQADQVFLKVAPDLEPPEAEAIAGWVNRSGIGGLIATNTTRVRPEHLPAAFAKEQGGLSGEPLREKSLTLLRSLASSLNPSVRLIGVGGVSTGRDLLRVIASGAHLAQVYTGLIYRGPFTARHILDEARAILAQHQLSSFEQVHRNEDLFKALSAKS